MNMTSGSGSDWFVIDLEISSTQLIFDTDYTDRMYHFRLTITIIRREKLLMRNNNAGLLVPSAAASSGQFFSWRTCLR